ncbi:DUF2326 domain-containing protein [Marinifilum fragile]|uniref:DUF2326 domain-containing protein n=1 Tax=Marinifilum fragile TaxID=570161 RepID=UPI002AA7FC1E|nr:DUF2326 domain-containing protein [Marinifilum fragile]
MNGLNVIYADVISDLKENKNSHDLGKTKLAELIDFLFLKEINKKHFLLKIKENDRSIFSEYIFYLELLLNSGKFLTIRRGVTDNTKISFAINDQRFDGYNPPHNWDHENVTLKKSKDILSDYLALDFFKNKEYSYRKSISYSLRRQGDFKDVYKLNKFSLGRDIDWKPFMFDLLGFNGDFLRLKYKNDNEIESIKTFIENLKREYSVRIEDRDEVVAEKLIVESEYIEIESQIDRFNFYNHDKELIKQGIDDIENKINVLNAQSYALNYEVDKIRTSIKNKFSFDINKVEKVFDEAQVYFPDQLKADYSDLIEFNKKLTTERNKLLKITLEKKSAELKSINTELLQINLEREKLLADLTDSDTFTRFKTCQKDLVKVEGKLLKFDEKLKTIDTIINQQQEIEHLKDQIRTTVDSIKSIYQTTDKNLKYGRIRKHFSKYYKAIINENAVLSWNINTQNNVEFIPPKVKSKFDHKKDTAKDEGNTYMKLLCVAFDLAILISYNEESYYRFVYHDDVLSQQDNGIKLRLLKLVDDTLKENNLQYILSAIKADLPVREDSSLIEFDDDDIVLRLHDKDPSGTLFGFEF